MKHLPSSEIGVWSLLRLKMLPFARASFNFLKKFQDSTIKCCFSAPYFSDKDEFRNFILFHRQYNTTTIMWHNISYFHTTVTRKREVNILDIKWDSVNRRHLSVSQTALLVFALKVAISLRHSSKSRKFEELLRYFVKMQSFISIITKCSTWIKPI